MNQTTAPNITTRKTDSCEYKDIVAVRLGISSSAIYRKPFSISCQKSRPIRTIRSKRPSGSSPTCRTRLRFSTLDRRRSTARSRTASPCPREAGISLSSWVRERLRLMAIRELYCSADRAPQLLRTRRWQ